MNGNVNFRFNWIENKDAGKIRCRVCDQKKPRESFNKSDDGLRLHTHCKVCEEYLARNPL